MTDIQELLRRIHKAQPPAEGDTAHCAICGQRIKQVAGGSGLVYVHKDSQVILAPNPPSRMSEDQRLMLIQLVRAHISNLELQVAERVGERELAQGTLAMLEGEK